MADCRKFYFVRHGETDWNSMARFQGRNDIPLNEAGLKQAATVALRLEQCRAAAVVTSPLSRARRVAEIIAGDNRKIVVCDELTEQYFGAWERMTLSDIRVKYNDEYKAWLAGTGNVPDGEREIEIFDRALRVVEKLREIEDEETIVVSHGGILRYVLLAWLRGECSPIFWRMRLDNCSITTAEIRNGKCTLCSVNDTLHFKVGSEDAVRTLPLA